MPTRGLLVWIEGVAATFTGMRLGQLRMAHVLLLGAALAIVVATRRRRGAVLVAWLAIGAVLAAPLLAERTRPAPVPQVLAVGWESTLWWTPRSAVLLLGRGENAERLLGDIRLAGAERIDLIVASGGGTAVAGDVSVLQGRHGPAVVWAPAGNRIAGATVPAVSSAAAVGDLVVSVETVTERLEVRVNAVAGAG